MRRFALPLLLAGTTLLGTASAQEVTLYPGHPDLDTRALSPADVTQDIRTTGPERQAVGVRVETATLDGDVLTLVTRVDADGELLDSTRVAWPSLAPLSQTIVAGSNRGAATFSGTTLSGTYGGDAPQPFELSLPTTPFPQSVLPYVIRALPLDQTGYQATAPVFSPQSRLSDIYLTVEGPETVTLPNGATVDAVVVVQEGGPGGTQRHVVDPATREILQTDIRMQGMTLRASPVTADELAALRAQDAAAAAEADAAREAAAQNRIQPGSDVLVPVSPQTVTYTVRLTQPAEQRLGTIAVTETLADGRLVMVSDVEIPAAGQNQQDSTVVAYPSLEGISRVTVTPSKTERLAFADGRMTGSITEGESTSSVDAAVDGAFIPGLTRLIVRSLPLAEGYSASYTTVDADGEVSTSFVSVTGQETYTRADGTEGTGWIVVESEEGTPDYAYHVDAETRELYKIAFAPQPGLAIEMVVE